MFNRRGGNKFRGGNRPFQGGDRFQGGKFDVYEITPRWIFKISISQSLEFL